MIGLDFHVHTTASPDSVLAPEALLRACRRRGLAGLAVTDHNRLAGALALSRLAPADLRIIVGEEVRTVQGELLGLFLHDEIAPRQDAWETARAIRAQGGLVGVPHPCDRWRARLSADVLEDLARAGLVDFVEGRNGRVVWPGDNRRAEELGHRLGLPLTAGSDAHSAVEVGACWTLLAPFDGPQEFLAALRQAELQGRPSPPWVHLASTLAQLRRRRG